MSRGKKETVGPEAVLAARLAADLTQTEAGELIHIHQRTWADYESGRKLMPVDRMELFMLKVMHPKICESTLEEMPMK